MLMGGQTGWTQLVAAFAMFSPGLGTRGGAVFLVEERTCVGADAGAPLRVGISTGCRGGRSDDNLLQNHAKQNIK